MTRFLSITVHALEYFVYLILIQLLQFFGNETLQFLHKQPHCKPHFISKINIRRIHQAQIYL